MNSHAGYVRTEPSSNRCASSAEVVNGLLYQAAEYGVEAREHSIEGEQAVHIRSAYFPPLHCLRSDCIVLLVSTVYHQGFRNSICVHWARMALHGGLHRLPEDGYPGSGGRAEVDLTVFR